MKLFTAAFFVALLGCGSSTPAPVVPEPATPQPPEPPQTVEPAEPAALDCGDGLGAARLTLEQAAERYGEGADKFADAPTTMKQPIEVCGVRGQLQWLMVARCGDTTNPFRTSADAHAARAGSMGAGGRCDHVIDRYTVACPENTYEVFMDLYMCGPGEELR